MCNILIIIICLYHGCCQLFEDHSSQTDVAGHLEVNPWTFDPLFNPKHVLSDMVVKGSKVVEAIILHHQVCLICKSPILAFQTLHGQ